MSAKKSVSSMFVFLILILLCPGSSRAQSLAELLLQQDLPGNLLKWHLSSDQPKTLVTDASMDVLDIAQEPDGKLVGIYHGTQKISGSFPPGISTLKVAMADNVDQPIWKHMVDIDTLGGSLGSIERLEGGDYLVTYEKKPSLGRIHSFVQVMYFPSLEALLRNQPTRQYTVPEWEGNPRIVQGTPSFRAIAYDPDPDKMTIELGYHIGLGGRDVNAIGTMTGFKTWTYQLNTLMNDKMTEAGVTHSIGGRAHINFNGKPYTIVEGQKVKGDFSTFSLYLYDETDHTVTPLPFKTPNGGVAFGNPKFSLIKHNGLPILVGTFFSFNKAPYGANTLFTRKLPSGVTLDWCKITGNSR